MARSLTDFSASPPRINGHSPATSPGGVPELKAVPLPALRAELRNRERIVLELESRRRELMSELEALDRHLAFVNGAAEESPDGGPRFRNSETLVEALSRVLKGQTLTVARAAEAVQRAGYRTASRSFRTQVNIALIRSGRFKRVTRGLYTAAEGA